MFRYYLIPVVTLAYTMNMFGKALFAEKVAKLNNVLRIDDDDDHSGKKETSDEEASVSRKEKKKLEKQKLEEQRKLEELRYFLKV